MQSTKIFSAAAQTQDVDIGGSRDVSINVTGAMTATLVPKVSRDGGATYDTLGVMNTAGAIVGSITAAGRFYPIGLKPGDKFRLECTAYTSGTPQSVVETY